MNSPHPTSYDEVPYKSLPFPQTHPDRIAIIAALLGLSPPPVQKCRVLELGTAAGGNLIPMALALPESTFTGIDLSARQIADGQRLADALGLKNLTLRNMSIAEVTRDFGEFDYIIAHGVYTWVPPEVKEALLRLCGENLSPNGVAYVSYNVYPGWHMRGMIRDMMRYHASRFQETSSKIAQARGLLHFLAKAVPTQNSTYGMLLNDELKFLSKLPDYYLLHDHLEDFNEPIYFHEFVERARKHRLQYLAEAVFASMASSVLPPEVAKKLSEVAFDVVSYEQYLDFVRNRTFRQTLLVHEGVAINRKLNWKDVTRYAVSSNSNLKPVSPRPDIQSNATEQFSGTSTATLTSGAPIVKSAMTILAEIDPMPIAFARLQSQAREKLSPVRDVAATTEDDERRLAGAIIQAYSVGLVELTQLPARFVLRSNSERPVASALARLQAANSAQVANLLHKVVTLDEAQRRILLLLDGTRDRSAVAASLTALHASGELKLQGLSPGASPGAVKQKLGNQVQQAIEFLGRMALLSA